MRIRVVLVLLLALLVVASQAGRWLVVDAPQPSDVIVVLAGEASIRPAYGVEMLRRGMAPRVFLNVQAYDVLYQQPLPELAERYIKSLPEKEKVVAPTRFSGKPLPSAGSTPVNSFLQPLPAFNPAGRSITALDEKIARPTGIQPLPGITGPPKIAPTTRPEWQAQLPPWLTEGPQSRKP